MTNPMYAADTAIHIDQSTISSPHTAKRPHLYRIPETQYVRRQRAANHHIYDIPAPMPAELLEPQRGYWALETAKFEEASRQAWADLKALGRKLVQWLMWRLVVPLAALSGFAIFSAEPAEFHDGYYRDVPYSQDIIELP